MRSWDWTIPSTKTEKAKHKKVKRGINTKQGARDGETEMVEEIQLHLLCTGQVIFED
jgi:hypothetical protein